MNKACVVLHVNWQTIVGNLTDDPSTTTSAHVHLEDGKDRIHQNS